MNPERFTHLVARLMRQPAAPYHEAAPRAEAERICAEHGLAHARDRFGNVLITLRTEARQRPFVLAAHLDHPGFEIVKELAPGRWQARFLGGVPEKYFQPGVPLRLLPNATKAILGEKIIGTEEPEFEIVAPGECEAQPEFAVWELPDFELRDGQIHGRVCDDLIGCAAILATLIDLKESGAKVDVIGVLSRAEEVGFHGALALAAAKTLPMNSLIVSLETSREMPPVQMGRGVIVRVGDRVSVFDSDATRFLCEAAAQLQTRESDFHFQRALMSGGACEATAYQEFGYQCAGVCVALGNYHNCGAHDQIVAEFVNLEDARGLARVLTEAALQMKNYRVLVEKLPLRLKNYLRTARQRLRDSTARRK